MVDGTDHERKQGLTQCFHDTKPVLSALALDYQIACDAAAHEKTRREIFETTQDEVKLRTGQLTLDQINRIVKIPLSILVAQEKKRAEAKNGGDFLFIISLLDDIRERLEELEASMARRYETLRSTYGDDVFGGMVATFLPEEVARGLRTDKQRLEALSGLFLDENGNIRDTYKGLEEAQYVRDWNEAQTLKPIVAKYEGRDDLTTEERFAIRQVAATLPNTDRENTYLQSGNHQFKDTVEQTMDTGRAGQELVKTNALLPFG